jgi:signal transduction histidine kinase
MKALLSAPFERRARAEVRYAVLALVLAAVGYGYVLAALVLGVGLAVTAIGIPIVAFAVTGARRLGALHRALARHLLEERIEPPAPRPPADRFYGRVQAGLGDVVGWRALAYLLLQPAVAVLQGVVVLFTWCEGIVTVTYPVQHALGLNRVAMFDALWTRLLLIPAGLALLLLAPWAVRAATLPNRMLLRWLLGPYRADQRIRELEHGRAVVVHDAAATLRRIERDLHDGAQVRLIGLTMQLTMLKEAAPDGPVRELAAAAHASAREAVAELRELVRGIHPPMLDQGLEAALPSLAARIGLPVQVHADLPERPAEAIETVAYFCAAELLANAVKHSAAGKVLVEAGERNGRLRLVVRDDGAGGARITPGGGLAGLLERVRAVDGELHVDSAPGGPTVVTVDLPARL